MSVVTTINLVGGGSSTYTGATVNLTQDGSGYIYYNGTQVAAAGLSSLISGSDTNVTLHLVSSNNRPVVVRYLQGSMDPDRADAGGVQWSVPATYQCDIKITAPTISEGVAEYIFDDVTQPAVKLKVVVQRQ
jgi:hypothetical protein